MSSTASESVEDTPMARIIKSLIGDLNYLAILKNEQQFGFSAAESLYESVYEFGRNIYLHPNYRQYLTEEDKKILKEYFPVAFVRLVAYTPALTRNIDPWMLNLARTRRSQLFFIKNELIDLYKELNENELTMEVLEALKKLEISDNALQFDIENYTRRDYRDAVDDPNDVPNLNGVPLSHNWWTQEHRDMSKNKKE